VWSFLRKSKTGAPILFLVNATPVVREGYRVGVPETGFWNEVLNTDAQTYGGSNVGNYGGQFAEDGHSWQGKPHSLLLNLPPLSVIGFRLEKSL
jgi:1,4-alpha-glucan branching enzyme